MPHLYRPAVVLRSLTFVLILAVIGCSTMTTTDIPGQNIPHGKGIAYCLPVGKVTIKVERTEHPDKEETTTTTVTTTDIAEAPKPNNGNGNLTAPEIGGAQGNSGGSNSGAPSAAEKEKEGAKGKTVKTVVSKKVPVNPTYRISYVGTVYVPDLDKRFTVRYRPNAMADDNIRVVLTPDSLLDLVDITTEDRTVDVVKKVMEIVKNVARITAQSGSPTTIIYQATFDPLDAGAIDEVNKDLATLPEGPFQVSILRRSPSRYTAKGSDYRNRVPAGSNFSGIAYRPVLAYDLRLKGSKHTHEVATVLLPNEAEVLYFPITRSAFVKKVTKLEFERGILVEATVNKPSEVLAGADIPLEITRTIAALPGEIAGENVAKFNRRSQVSTARGSAVSAEESADRVTITEEVKTLEERTKLLKARDDYERARKNAEEAAKTP